MVCALVLASAFVSAHKLRLARAPVQLRVRMVRAHDEREHVAQVHAWLAAGAVGDERMRMRERKPTPMSMSMSTPMPMSMSMPIQLQIRLCDLMHAHILVQNHLRNCVFA